MQTIDINAFGEVPFRNPFPHQQEAILRLLSVCKHDDTSGKYGLLVIPTGGGKTFTTVRWIVDNVLARKH